LQSGVTRSANLARVVASSARKIAKLAGCIYPIVIISV
jgi:hypothetical protein